MKRIFLLTLAAAALTGNAGAQQMTVWQQIGRALETQANVAMRQEARAEAEEYAAAQQAAAQAKAEHEKKIQLAYKTQAERNRRRDEAFALDAQSNPAYHTDTLPLWNQYDDAATIRVYLRDSGYSITEAQVLQVQDYMKAHQIKHVSQLGI